MLSCVVFKVSLNITVRCFSFYFLLFLKTLLPHLDSSFTTAANFIFGLFNELRRAATGDLIDLDTDVFYLFSRRVIYDDSILALLAGLVTRIELRCFRTFLLFTIGLNVSDAEETEVTKELFYSGMFSNSTSRIGMLTLEGPRGFLLLGLPLTKLILTSSSDYYKLTLSSSDNDGVEAEGFKSAVTVF